jgi:hypothetical protein
MTKHQQNLKPKTEATTLPAPLGAETLAQLDADIAALAAEARELTEDVRIGDDLKFKKGKWTKIIGDEETKIGPTTTFAVDMRSYKRGWIEWRDRKPVRKFIGRPIDGFVSPPRDRFPDRDESQWPRDARGNASDPWQENFLIVMRDLGDGRLCTWTTTSWYGQKALGTLLNVYVRDQKKHPDQMPVVLLSSETKTTMNYGDVEAPVLSVIDWQPFGPDAAPPGVRMPTPTLAPAQEVLLPKPAESLRDAMNDEIPF